MRTAVEDLELQLTQLAAHDGDVFLLHFPRKATPEEVDAWVAAVDRWLADAGRPKVFFLAMPHDVTVETMTKTDMARRGWQRIKREER